MIKIVLAEHDSQVREGFRVILESEAAFSVVGEAGDGLEAVRIVTAESPDVLVMTATMPGLPGIAVIRQQMPRTKIVVLSRHDDDATVQEALRRGASAYLLKRTAAAELIRAVRAVSQGRRYLGPPFFDRAIEAYLRVPRVQRGAAGPLKRLTHREREVLQLTVEGYTSRDIGERLSISARTVEKHRSNLMRKLGLNSRAALMQFALSRGIDPSNPAPSEGT